MADTKLSADLRISKKFKYTPIFKTSFIKAKAKPRRKCCSCCASKEAGITGYILLGVLFILCIIGASVFWTTNIFHSLMIKESLPLKNNSKSFEWWRNPPSHPRVHVYLFNYTNVHEFLSKGEKLKVQEVGPYTYLEKVEKVNIVWNNNGTITFQNRRSFTFLPELSNGGEHDKIVVPNLPLLAAAATVRNEIYIVKLSLATFLHSVNAKPFVNLDVKQLLWGYEDPIFTVGRTVISMKHRVTKNKFGLMVEREGLSPWRITVGTGELDIGNLGVVSHYNGIDHIDFWKSEECNRIDGAEGALFPPHAVKEQSRLHVYNREMCHRFPFVFKEHTKGFHGIPTLRFHPPRNVFGHPHENPDNACFCDPERSVCPPSGVFNVSPCVYDTPFLISFPHFYLGDPTLLETVDGLHPDEKKHDMFIDLHPELGVPLAGKTSFQINMMVNKVSGIDHLYRFKDRAILPISYFNVVIDELPSEVRMALFHGFHSARTFQLTMMYGLPVAAAAIALALLRALRRWRRAPDCEPPSPEIMLPSAAAVAAVASLDQKPDDIFVVA